MKVSEHDFNPQLFYAGERAPIAYWVGSRVSLHIGEKRETLACVGN